MSLFRHHSRDYFYTSPMERFMQNLLDSTFDEGHAYRPLQTVAPYWLHQPVLNECNIGNAMGEVKDEKDKFAVQIDVSHFHPKELSVSVRDRELAVEGHQKERSDQLGRGSIERHFVRKYHLPEEAQLDTIESHLSDKGVLTVTANKTVFGASATRNIPIRASPKESETDRKRNSNDAEK
uniref:SHSP domain-containing protein n=1 Tax=Setaria digitata TaxID=48799 RepID=A0A915PKD2_9BILA